MSKHQISDAEYAAALSNGREARATEPRARSVRYLADRDGLEIETMREGAVFIARSWVNALQDVPIEELPRLQVWPDGSAIELEERDIQISVEGLIAHRSAMLEKQEEALQELATQTQQLGLGY